MDIRMDAREQELCAKMFKAMSDQMRVISVAEALRLMIGPTYARLDWVSPKQVAKLEAILTLPCLDGPSMPEVPRGKPRPELMRRIARFYKLLPHLVHRFEKVRPEEVQEWLAREELPKTVADNEAELLAKAAAIAFQFGQRPTAKKWVLQAAAAELWGRRERHRNRWFQRHREEFICEKLAEWLLEYDRAYRADETQGSLKAKARSKAKTRTKAKPKAKAQPKAKAKARSKAKRKQRSRRAPRPKLRSKPKQRTKPAPRAIRQSPQVRAPKQTAKRRPRRPTAAALFVCFALLLGGSLFSIAAAGKGARSLPSRSVAAAQHLLGIRTSSLDCLPAALSRIDKANAAHAWVDIQGVRFKLDHAFKIARNQGRDSFDFIFTHRGGGSPLLNKMQFIYRSNPGDDPSNGLVVGKTDDGFQVADNKAGECRGFSKTFFAKALDANDTDQGLRALNVTGASDLGEETSPELPSLLSG